MNTSMLLQYIITTKVRLKLNYDLICNCRVVSLLKVNHLMSAQQQQQGGGVVSLSRKLIIAVDVDEVLAAFIPAVANFHNAVYSTSLSAASFHSYEFDKVWGGSKEESSEKVVIQCSDGWMVLIIVLLLA